MLHAHSFFGSYICASFFTASFELCPMLNAHSSIDDYICASFTTASFELCPMLNAHSSFLSFICASFTAASCVFYLCTMPNAHSSLDNYIGASSTAASPGFNLCTMPKEGDCDIAVEYLKEEKGDAVFFSNSGLKHDAKAVDSSLRLRFAHALSRLPSWHI
jgi:hypothetical protein